MEMIKVTVPDVHNTCSLSPEQWLSSSSLLSSEPGVALSMIADSTKRGGASDISDSLVLDTAHALTGLLRLPDSLSVVQQKRTSHKKRVPEGSVIISRLRPYLRQVAYVPVGLRGMIDGRSIVCSTEFYVLTPKDEESIAYLVPWLLSAKVQDIFAKATTGGHHPRFDESLLWGLQVPYPIYEGREAISRSVEEATLSALRAQNSLEQCVREC
jgi:hypothetical protein